MSPEDVDLQRLLRAQFGHEAFRPGQERVIRDLLRGRDVLAVLPTGAGKSLVYQLAAQLLPGVTIVVSPLIALMRDQEAALARHGLEAGVINSSQSEQESAAELGKVQHAGTKLLYVAPERFDDEAFMAAMRQQRVSLFVVDEAHCVSEWGHDFRPSYLELAGAAAALGRPTMLALTATATPWVRQEIIERLGLRDPDIVVRGVDRPNLFYEVRRVESEREDYQLLRRLLTDADDAASYDAAPDLAEELRRAMQGSGIVYTATTRAAETTARWLTEWGIAADCYHGRRRKADRERVQAAFMAGELRVIVATNAFGLGVDKPDIRFVIHRDVPGSVEAYYQEAGRAGRDGALARCTLIYRPGDLSRAAFLSASGQLTTEEVQRAHRVLVARREGTVRELAEASGVSRADLARLVAILKEDGLAEERRGRVRLLVPDFDPANVSLEREAARRAYERSRVEMMRGYAELRDCRRRYLLNYFGEEYEAERCGRCDNDIVCADPELDDNHPEAGNPAFAVNDRVVHPSFGEGVVQRVTRGQITVLFGRVGYKTLDVGLVAERGLLTKAAP